MSNAIRERFAEFFDRESPAEMAQQEEQFKAERQDGLERLRRITNAGPFIQSDFKPRLHRLAAESKWKVGMTQEQAAQALIAQTIYMDILEELDRMTRAATESADD